MESCIKFDYLHVAPVRFRVIGKKNSQGAKMTPTRAKVKLATYSATDAATSNKSLQNTYIGRSRRAEHEYGIRFFCKPNRFTAKGHQSLAANMAYCIESVYPLKCLFIYRFTKVLFFVNRLTTRRTCLIISYRNKDP